MSKISVIIPVYNVEKYLDECLNSIINQTLQDLEIICINDGSIDNSSVILNKHKMQDSRIVIINQNNKGQASARNVGLHHASGEYVYFMDGDDILELNALDKAYQTVKENDLEIVYFDARCIYENEKLRAMFIINESYYIRKEKYNNVFTGKELFYLMKKNNDYCVSPCMQLVKLTYLTDNNIYFPEGIYHEDVLFNFICMLQSNKIKHIPEKLFIRRIREESTVTQKATFKHAYGWFIDYLKMVSFITDKEYDDEILTQIIKEISSATVNLINVYSELDDDEKSNISKLTVYERNLFNLLIANPYSLLNETLRMRRSITYRLGSLITWIPLKIKTMYIRFRR